MNLHMKMAVAVASLAGAALLLPGLASATPTNLPIPAVPGVAGLPGPIAPAATAAQTMTTLTTTPDTGVPGTKFALSGGGLPANKPVTLTWSTANVTWTLDPRPDTVDYLGRVTTKFAVVLATAQTDANGNFNAQLKIPQDWGGLHDIYAVVDGVQYAKGGVLLARWAKISPKSGPVGTPITVTYGGLGSSLYEGGAALLYDNKFTGALTANWTRGIATAHIRASGPVGTHVISLDNAVNFGYLNVQQSPLPWTTEFHMKFKVTPGVAGKSLRVIDWPTKVQPTVDAKTTLQLLSTSNAQASLSATSGQVNSKVDLTASGLAPSTATTLDWSTVVGNRVNCTSTCWSFTSVPVGTATTTAAGTLAAPITIPDGLGGWHVLRILQDGAVKAQVPYYIKRSVVYDQAIKVKEGQIFHIHLKGVGWTELDNTLAVDYDNSYVGYGCGFNSQGDVVLNLLATGGPGVHLIDMYPLLYTQSPSYPNTPYGMQPFLAYADDAPGLALGYELPAIRLAVTVVK
jgi:hypothetical protein